MTDPRITSEQDLISIALHVFKSELEMGMTLDVDWDRLDALIARYGQRCSDCLRRIGYSDERDFYHLETPEVGCFLIPAQTPEKENANA